MSLTLEDNVYTYADYKAWGENERIEIIDGATVMQASPSTAHQDAAGRLYAKLLHFLKGKAVQGLSCTACGAPERGNGRQRYHRFRA